jgi:hypothetical protein
MPNTPKRRKALTERRTPLVDDVTNPTPKRYNMMLGDKKVDPYRILKLYGITDPGQQHAIKKLLRAGRSDKSWRQDMIESRDALQRSLDMDAEDNP